MDSSPSDQALSLDDLLSTIGALVKDTFPVPIWVRCEVKAALAKPKGFWVLEVQDPDLGRQAQARVMVWRHAVPRVIQHFAQTVGQALSPGMQILLRVKVEYSAEWGLSLIAEGIDPDFTLGQAHLETERVRGALKAQGLWERNRRLPAPPTFCRVALIAPGGSAGLGDVQVETRRLEAAGLCRFDVHLAAFEGPNAVREIVDTLNGLNDPTAYDAICLVRGGGGTSGIQTLDQQPIVEAVCRCPIPVFVGIGHERDHTLLDEVAFLSLGTPSKAIGHITHTLMQQAQAAQEAWVAIEQTVRQRLDDAEQRTRALREETHRRAEQGLAQAELAMERLHQEMALRSGRLLERAEEDSQALMREALGLGPATTLARGYVWVSGPEGPVTQAQHAREAKRLTLHFADGDVATHPEPTP